MITTAWLDIGLGTASSGSFGGFVGAWGAANRVATTVDSLNEAPVAHTAPECPDCRVTMELGWIMDFTQGGIAPTWVRGSVEKGFWGVKVRGKERLPVNTFRCPKCGQLKSFAQPA